MSAHSQKHSGLNLQDPFSIHTQMAELAVGLKVTKQIDGERVHGPISFREFCAVNADLAGELKLIASALENNGVYQGGGGAASVFTVRMALESALAIFNAEFQYDLRLPIDRDDLEAAIQIANLRGRDDIARKIVAACAHLPARVVEPRTKAPGMVAPSSDSAESGPPSPGFGAVKEVAA
jgi:hypothetical protein